ncbi:hypothetical protein ABH968_001243 [Lysinibacillus sp. RC79]
MLHMNVSKKFKTSYQIKFSNAYRFLCVSPKYKKYAYLSGPHYECPSI